MSWYSDSNNHDIAVSTRIRLARNINGFPFPSRMSEGQFAQISDMVKNAINQSNTPFAKSLKFIKMEDIPEIERYSMVERHVISREFASSYKNRAIIISQDESICVMIGEEDHIRIQVILSGMQLEKAYDLAESIDALLCANLDIAFDERLGFLTECPTNLGTGLRASVMLHLPASHTAGQVGTLANSVSKIGFTVRGLYGEGSKSGAALYQISNQITLGINEKNAIDNLKIIASQIIDKENQYRSQINALSLEDVCMRAVGILKNARIISSGETMQRLSDVKLGVSSGVIEDPKLNLFELLVDSQPYMLMKKNGTMNADERDSVRAEMLRGVFERI